MPLHAVLNVLTGKAAHQADAYDKHKILKV